MDDADSGVYIDSSLAALKAIINALTNSTAQFLEAETQRIFEDENVRMHVRDAMPYIYAAAFLSLQCGEINEENLAKTLKSVGVEANPSLAKPMFKANVRNHLVYIYAYYLLLALGKIGSESELLAVVDSLGIESDTSRLKDVLMFLKAPLPAEWAARARILFYACICSF